MSAISIEVNQGQSDQIRALLSASVGTLAVFDQLGSTNDTVRELNGPRPACCVALQQHAGRGRRGRQWLDQDGITFSLLFESERSAEAFLGLSVAVGLALAEALSALGARSLKVKWPNDLYHEQAKLAGVLIEHTLCAGGGSRLVIGVGLNYTDSSAFAALDQPVSSLAQAFPSQALPDKTTLTACAISAVLSCFERFDQRGLAACLARWSSYDFLSGAKIQLEQAGQLRQGQALGLDPRGALLVEIDGKREVIHAGEVSVRREQTIR